MRTTVPYMDQKLSDACGGPFASLTAGVLACWDILLALVARIMQFLFLRRSEIPISNKFSWRLTVAGIQYHTLHSAWVHHYLGISRYSD